MQTRLIVSLPLEARASETQFYVVSVSDQGRIFSARKKAINGYVSPEDYNTYLDGWDYWPLAGRKELAELQHAYESLYLLPQRNRDQIEKYGYLHS